MKRSEHRSSNAIDICSVSPPPMQFAVGTPPNSGGSRRRSTSGGSLSETPPPPSTWQVSPSSHQSPLRRSGTTSPILPSAMIKLPALGSPNLLIENNNHNILGQRAFTLPDLGATGGLRNFYSSGSINSTIDDHSNKFHALELPAETLLDREHNEILTKLNFVLAITDCIVEVADSKCPPFSVLMSADEQQQHPIPLPQPPHSPENCKVTERLVLLVR